MGRPEEDWNRREAMTELGLGLHAAKRCEEALTVQLAELSMEGRLGTCEYNLLILQGNLAGTYQELGRREEATRMLRDVGADRAARARGRAPDHDGN